MVARLKSNKVINGDALLYAVGRQGNVDELNLAAAGLEADNRGRIAVDAEYRTKVPNIYRRGRRDRVPEPGVGLDGAGAPGRGERRGAEDPVQSGDLSVRHLHDSRDLLHRARRKSS